MTESQRWKATVVLCANAETTPNRTPPSATHRYCAQTELYVLQELQILGGRASVNCGGPRFQNSDL